MPFQVKWIVLFTDLCCIETSEFVFLIKSEVHLQPYEKMWDMFIIYVLWRKLYWKALKIMCAAKYKLSVPSAVALTGLGCLPYIDRSFMGLHEWKYAYNRVLQCSIWDGKAQFSLESLCFPNNRELFGNESNKKTHFKLALCLCFDAVPAAHAHVDVFTQPSITSAHSENTQHTHTWPLFRFGWCTFTVVTYRWHHRSGSLIQPHIRLNANTLPWSQCTVCVPYKKSFH